MNDSPFASGEFSYDENAPLRRPPKMLFWAGLLSVGMGVLLGIYGFDKSNFGIVASGGATGTEQQVIGVLGYLLTAIIPIVILQIIRMGHAKAVAQNKEQAYDIYAGSQMLSRFLKVVLVGVVSAALPIWIFLIPIAEVYAN